MAQFFAQVAPSAQLVVFQALSYVRKQVSEWLLPKPGFRKVGSGKRLKTTYSVAVGVARGNVSPSPVGVESDGSSLGRAAGAASARTCRPAHRRVLFSLLSTDLLSAGGSEERKRGEKSLVHDEGAKNDRWMLEDLVSPAVALLIYRRLFILSCGQASFEAW